MDDEQVSEAICELEGRLLEADRAFVRRFDATPLRERWAPVASAALLAAAAVLLAAGLATPSLLAWCLGAVALVGACAVEVVPRLVDRLLPVGQRRAG